MVNRHFSWSGITGEEAGYRKIRAALKVYAVGCEPLKAAFSKNWRPDSGVSIDVRYWHLADIDADARHVRSSGVKRTWPVRALVSANDLSGRVKAVRSSQLRSADARVWETRSTT